MTTKFTPTITRPLAAFVFLHPVAIDSLRLSPRAGGGI